MLRLLSVVIYRLPPQISPGAVERARRDFTERRFEDQLEETTARAATEPTRSEASAPEAPSSDTDDDLTGGVGSSPQAPTEGAAVPEAGEQTADVPSAAGEERSIFTERMLPLTQEIDRIQ